MSLEFDVNEARRVIDEETTARKHFALACLASGCEETTLGTTNEVIYRDAFTRKEMVLLEYPLSVANNR
jgi:hypothetical protein